MACNALWADDVSWLLRTVKIPQCVAFGCSNEAKTRKDTSISFNKPLLSKLLFLSFFLCSNLESLDARNVNLTGRTVNTNAVNALAEFLRAEFERVEPDTKKNLAPHRAKKIGCHVSPQCSFLTFFF